MNMEAPVVSAETDGLVRPKNFLIILGAAKCGTTSLASALAAHPKVRMSTVAKETMHFTDFGDREWIGPGSDGLRRNMVADRDRFKAAFGCVEADEWALDGSTDYMWCAASPAKIADFARTHRVKPVVVLRDPIDRAFSEFKHTRRDAFQNLTFRQSLDKEQERRDAGMHPLFYHTTRGKYHGQIQAYQAIFGADLMIVDYRDLQQDFEGVAATILADIGLGDAAKVEMVRENVGYAHRSMVLYNILRNKRLKSVLGTILPRPVRAMVRKRFEDMNRMDLELEAADAEYVYTLMADDIEACLADPLIPTDTWKTVHKTRARLGH